jgi:hypothetical protein
MTIERSKVRPPPPQSYLGAPRLYVELVSVLERYIARLQVTAIIDAALHRLNLHRRDMSSENLDRVVEETGAGLRLFCDPERLPALMLELAALCERNAA